jgi:outer membrane receptor protein involved in Fe transport
LLAAVASPAGWAQGPALEPAEVEGGQGANVTSYSSAFFARFRPNTAMDMIKRIPGFAFNGGSGARGFSGTGGNVLIDGERPPSRDDSLSSVIGRIPSEGVERIDIIRGGAEGIDMQGLPIIANIIRKPDVGWTGAFSASASVNEPGNLSGGSTLQLRNQSNGQMFEGSLDVGAGDGSDSNRRWRIAPDGGLLLLGEAGSTNDYQDIHAKGAWETDLFGGRLRANGAAGVETSSSGSLEDLVVPGGVQIRASESHETEGEAGIRYTRELSGGHALEFVGFQSLEQDERESLFNTPDFTSGSGSESFSGESIVSASIKAASSGDWSFDGGGEAVYNFSDSSRSRALNGQPFELDGDESEIEELRGEAFGSATWAPSDELSVETGLRYEWSRINAAVGENTSEKQLDFFKPRVNVSWAPDDGQQWGLQVERVVEQLDFGAFASSAEFDEEVFGVGNADIEPQKLWVVDARYEHQFGGQNSLVVGFVHTRIEDFLGRTVVTLPPADPADPPSTFEIDRNLGVATRDALELDATMELDSLGMEGGIFSFGVDLRDSNVADPVTGEERLLSNQDEWAWNLSLQQILADGNFRWSISMNDNADTLSWSPRSVEDGHGGPFLGANVSWKPSPGWTLGASLNNLIAEDASFDRVFYDAPRNTGSPEYVEYRTSDSIRSMNVSVRRDF